MEVASSDEEITLRLAAKPGERFDTTEISACLDHSLSKVNAVASTPGNLLKRRADEASCGRAPSTEPLRAASRGRPLVKTSAVNTQRVV